MTSIVLADRETPSRYPPTRAYEGVRVPFDSTFFLSCEVGNPCLACPQVEFLVWIGVCDVAIGFVLWLFLSVFVEIVIGWAILRIVSFGESGRERLYEISVSNGIHQP